MASSIINSDDGVVSGTSGIKTTGGDDGVLVFQSKGTETARINTDKQIVAAAGTASLPIYSTTGDLNTGIYFPAADNIAFTTGGTIRGRWTTDGLCFNADTAAANALDDYEEGTWTPALTFGGNSVSLTYTNRVGHYVRIGKVVYISFAISLSNKGSSSGSAYVTGMPFATQSQSLNQFFGLLTCASNVSSWQVGASWGLMFSDSNIYLRYNQASGEGSLNESNFTNTSNFGFTGFYFV
jgi:hypothetical protein